jgi:superfamily II DNA or RNA helicase
MSAQSPLQNSPPALGSPVVACRAWPWTVSARVRSGAISTTHLVSQASGSPDIDSVLEPFDILTPVAGAVRWRAASRTSLRELVARWPAVGWPDLPLVGAIAVPIDVLPHQLLPALAVAKGRATRMLLADPVGMGKTIEAGLVVRELQSRGAASRVLILTPATLRDQWRDEFHVRLAIRSSVVDRVAFEQRRRSMPPGITVFRPPGCHVMSLDLARQPDVLALLTGVTWDVLIVDEAHLAAGDTARAAATAEIAAHARVVLLLTATPHSGDPGAFRRLCSLGRLEGEPPIALIRSSAAATRRPPAVRREIAVPPTAAERVARLRLTACLRLLEDEGSAAARLVAVVLRKRALSSMSALAASLRHRLEWLDRQPGVASQRTLPFIDGELDDDDAAQPAVLREAPQCGLGEVAALARALEAATEAARDPGKLRMLSRLLARTRDRVIVFTEYRDTLDAVAAALSAMTTVASLHGGLDRHARTAALRRFTDGEARVLLATDVAAEGLNLQHACRLVVHFELPWSPARLAQRDGRVDRFGQSRRVHLWRLIGDRRHEARVLAALAGRVARMAAAGLDVAGLATPVHGDPVWTDCAPVDIDDSDVMEAAHAVMLVRRTLGLSARSRGGRTRGSVPWRRLRHRPDGLSRGVVVGLLVQRAGVGVRPIVRFVHVALSHWPEGHPSAWLPAVVTAAADRLPRTDTALSGALGARESRLAMRADLDQRRHRQRWQASLFEQRAAAVVAARREASAATLDEHRRRLAELDLAPPAATPVIALLVT